MIALSEKFGVDSENALKIHKGKMLPFLQKKIEEKLSQIEWLKSFCKQNLEEILVAEPIRLKELHDEIKPDLWSAFPIQKDRNSLVWSVFDYKGFTDKGQVYGAYELAANLGVQSCPYCNAQFTKTIIATQKTTRPTFDHFFPKADFPILSLSFYNLIPSCRVCNSDVKGKKIPSLDSHFHPYSHDIEDACRFTWHPQTTAGLQGLSEKFDLKIVSLKDHPEGDRAKNHVEFFHLETLYEAYKDQAAEVIQKKLAYPDSYLDQIQKLFPDARLSKSEIYRLAFGNYVDDKDLLKRPLSKMTRDLFNHNQNL